MQKALIDKEVQILFSRMIKSYAETALYKARR